ncbi:P4Hc, partial [Geosmithia morbida]
MPKPNKTKSKTAASPSQPVASTPVPPSWPPFKPHLPVVHLAPELHEATPMIALIPFFFPKSLCRDYVAFLRTLPMQTTPSRPKRGEAVRVNDRYQIQDPLFASRLWEQTGLKEAILNDNPHLQDLWGGEPVGLNPNIRVYRYSKGQYFDCHYDDSNSFILPSSPPVPVRTTWTLLLYLTSASEGCIGGETVFYPNDRRSAAEEIVVALETGMLLLHKHGNDCLL